MDFIKIFNIYHIVVKPAFFSPNHVNKHFSTAHVEMGHGVPFYMWPSFSSPALDTAGCSGQILPSHVCGALQVPGTVSPLYMNELHSKSTFVSLICL